jgi:hypothetical protein
MGDLMSRSEALECERVVRELEAAVGRLMIIEDGEEPLELHDGVQSVLLGSLAGKTVQVEIHVQPGLDDDYWSLGQVASPSTRRKERLPAAGFRQ